MEYLILGLLILSPMTGYELQQFKESAENTRENWFIISRRPLCGLTCRMGASCTCCKNHMVKSK